MIEKYVLDNGIHVICDEVSFYKTFSLGFWVGVGSIYEDDLTNGYTHFLEHVLFKGTKTRSYLDISKEIDCVGGYINAFTEHESTCFYVNMMTKYTKLGINVLWDIITNPTIESNELEKEKMVVLEEINMYEDSSEDLVTDLFLASTWKGHPMGYPILGNKDNIDKIDRYSIIDFYKKHYSSDNITISISGNFDKKVFIKEIECLSFRIGEKAFYKPKLIEPNFGMDYKYKELLQLYFNLGFKAFNRHNSKRYVLYLLTILLGGGSSSRLFVEVREKLGLCYSIYSYHKLFEEDGLIAIASSTSEDKYIRVLEVIWQEIDKLCKYGITEEELNLAKEQFIGNIIFEQESLEFRMIRNAKYEIKYGYQLPYEEAILNIKKVKVDDVNNIINELFKVESCSMFSLGAVDRVGFIPKKIG